MREIKIQNFYSKILKPHFDSLSFTNRCGYFETIPYFYALQNQCVILFQINQYGIVRTSEKNIFN